MNAYLENQSKSALGESQNRMRLQLELTRTADHRTPKRALGSTQRAPTRDRWSHRFFCRRARLSIGEAAKTSTTSTSNRKSFAEFVFGSPVQHSLFKDPLSLHDMALKYVAVRTSEPTYQLSDRAKNEREQDRTTPSANAHGSTPLLIQLHPTVSCDRN